MVGIDILVFKFVYCRESTHSDSSSGHLDEDFCQNREVFMALDMCCITTSSVRMRAQKQYGAYQGWFFYIWCLTSKFRSSLDKSAKSRQFRSFRLLDFKNNIANKRWIKSRVERSPLFLALTFFVSASSLAAKCCKPPQRTPTKGWTVCSATHSTTPSVHISKQK